MAEDQCRPHVIVAFPDPGGLNYFCVSCAKSKVGCKCEDCQKHVLTLPQGEAWFNQYAQEPKPTAL